MTPPSRDPWRIGPKSIRLAIFVSTLLLTSVWLVVVSELEVTNNGDSVRRMRTAMFSNFTARVSPKQRIQQLLQLSDGIRSGNDLYPEEIFEIDWSKQVPRRDVLHVGRLQRACVDNDDSVIPWSYGLNISSSQTATERFLTVKSAEEDVQTLLETLRKCPAVDIYLPLGIRGQGYCEDAAVYAKHLQARILPGWVLTQQFFDKSRNANVTYHDLCPHTPLLVFNHYWEDVRKDATWPATKPLYLMPNIEMFELEAHHYLRRADVILCKTVVCAQSLTKWFDQEGNPRMTQVLYTRFTSSDVATGALEASGTETGDVDWPEREKDFSNSSMSFTHTAGTSLWKGTQYILDCWLSRPDLPPVDIYIVEHFYNYGYKAKYGAGILASPNVNLYVGKLEAVAFGQMIADTTFFLCTSLMEGYGHYINNARAAGGLVVTADVPPMNELVTPSSGVLVRSSQSSMLQQFLGGTSPQAEALRDVPGFVAKFDGNAVCEAVDHIIQDMSADERRRTAQRARQQFFYDTAVFAKKMETLRNALQPASKRLRDQ